jgi:hypothetical protein
MLAIVDASGGHVLGGGGWRRMEEMELGACCTVVSHFSLVV